MMEGGVVMSNTDTKRQWRSSLDLIRHRWMSSRTVPSVWYELLWPKHLSLSQIKAWLYAMGGTTASRGFCFVVVAHKGRIHHYVVVPKRNEEHLLRLLTTFLSEIEIEKVPALALSPVLVSAVHTSSKNYALSTEHPEISNHAILSALQAVGNKESIVLAWNLHTRRSPQIPAKAIYGFSTMTVLQAFVRPPKEIDAHTRASLQAKHAKAAWKAALFIGVVAENRARRQQLHSQVVGALRSTEASDVRLTTRTTRAKHFSAAYRLRPSWPLLVNVDELAGLLGWPLGDRDIPGILRITSRRLAIPSTMPDVGRVIGTSVVKNSKKRLMQSVEDGLMHTHVIGPTGVGKSTLLLNLISQDIADGRGVIVVDPKGDLVTDVLARIPQERSDDIVVLDPTDLDYPVGLNPLARYDQPATLIADDVLSIFRKLYGSYFGPRSEDILHAGLLTLTSATNISLCALPVLYTNPVFRRRLVDSLDDPLGLGSFWSWFDTISGPQRSVALAPVMNKLRAFLLRPNIRRVIGQGEPRFDINDVFTKQKVLLVNLAKGNLGSEASQLFGSLIVSQIWQAVQSRASIPRAERKPVFLYIDEVQDYLHLPTDIADVLVQSRSYGVGMVLAHQHLGQFPKELKAAVLANARSRVCFQLAHEDAVAVLAKSPQLSSEDFENLRRFHIYARLVHDGRVSAWMSGRTMQPSSAISDPELLRTRSRELYGQAAADIETSLQAMLAGMRLRTTGSRR